MCENTEWRDSCCSGGWYFAGMNAGSNDQDWEGDDETNSLMQTTMLNQQGRRRVVLQGLNFRLGNVEKAAASRRARAILTRLILRYGISEGTRHGLHELVQDSEATLAGHVDDGPLDIEATDEDVDFVRGWWSDLPSALEHDLNSAHPMPLQCMTVREQQEVEHGMEEDMEQIKAEEEWKDYLAQKEKENEDGAEKMVAAEQARMSAGEYQSGRSTRGSNRLQAGGTGGGGRPEDQEGRNSEASMVAVTKPSEPLADTVASTVLEEDEKPVEGVEGDNGDNGDNVDTVPWGLGGSGTLTETELAAIDVYAAQLKLEYEHVTDRPATGEDFEEYLAARAEEAFLMGEKELRAAGADAWNRLFDEEELDAILIPGYLHTPTYECMAASTCVHQVKNMTSGEVVSRAEFTSVHSLFMHTLSMKHIPLPKMMVPVGLDFMGHPVGLQLLGRAGPPGSRGLGYSYDAELLKVVDVPFLKTAQALVGAMVSADPSLKRVEPSLVKGEGNLFE
ncbi:hypothetical protein AK812_SmicGene40685 [Symbiodinium microadriaticum]|uniref:Amidase domain-containing protein n=1 Tax=Symbiodinium microadriaticum TaxID=2951 RepID=A0A1Q9C7Z7_SYMMI|nr:hypothetical protein AK812_SmicGene40685 [Symbiodinium microadriaticum]